MITLNHNKALSEEADRIYESIKDKKIDFAEIEEKEIKITFKDKTTFYVGHWFTKYYKTIVNFDEKDGFIISGSGKWRIEKI